jgi:hypothetical protein
MAFTAGNQMDVSMTNGLSNSFTIIHADVEAAYSVSGIRQDFQPCRWLKIPDDDREPEHPRI